MNIYSHCMICTEVSEWLTKWKWCDLCISKWRDVVSVSFQKLLQYVSGTLLGNTFTKRLVH